ncbi:hypothetical protein CAPTEDRAFT_203431 [Capitella teleta]|uniref:CARD domain-containing protein n=1 Tax=Capitella teleta TaxID=283909 RepID=R7VA34_CAPTE|nr:hypothetical protein CAPTEDRAFT_203431 [Capitella teleta]|eukprot:ELU15479.1 hypothetical protein CAPTEDRAFT_203431 [Capitella teleta]
MSRKHKRTLKRNKCFILQNLLLSEIFFGLMMENGVITNDDREHILSNRYTTEKERISALLLRLVKRGPSAFSTFIRACSCSEQKHIADELTLNLTERNKTTSVDPKNEMSTLERAVLWKKRLTIMQLKLSKGFFDVIMEENIITQDMKEHILAPLHTTNKKRIAELLSFLPRRGPRAFKKFIKACVFSSQFDIAIALYPEYALELRHMHYKNNIMLNLSVVFVLALFVCGLQAAINDTNDMANMKADLLVHIVRELTSFPEICNDCSTLSELKMQGACCCFSDVTCRHIEVPGCNNELWAKLRGKAQS